ncbi:MAG TPA: prepilin-type N-terminal cleavage/methylation domain-containing protein [Rickettsiales bacterium]|nr:prepilin-type N-terminal cleavage/methylation domain-containing protein [Rickettsiales bacterium]
MIHCFQKENTGFTLIEISIVLVIIGLIVGGILTGQDLIKSATVRAQISQIEKYNTAINTFRNKYGGIPGDLAKTQASQFGFDVAGCDGSTGKRDGDGLVVGYSGGTYVLQYGEATVFWEDLSQAGLINGSYPSVAGSFSNCGITASDWTLTPGTTYIGNYFPEAKIGGGNFIYVYKSDTSTGGIDNANWYGISAVSSVTTIGGMASAGAISVLQAYNIDKKVDDGYPNRGFIRDLYLSSWWISKANAQASDSATSCYNTTANTYSVGINGGNGLNCSLSIRFQ